MPPSRTAAPSAAADRATRRASPRRSSISSRVMVRTSSLIRRMRSRVDAPSPFAAGLGFMQHEGAGDVPRVSPCAGCTRVDALGRVARALLPGVQSHLDEKRKWVFMISPARFRNQITRLAAWRLALVGLALAACAGPHTSVELAWTAPNADNAQLHRVVTLFVSRDVAL